MQWIVALNIDQKLAQIHVMYTFVSLEPKVQHTGSIW